MPICPFCGSYIETLVMEAREKTLYSVYQAPREGLINDYENTLESEPMAYFCPACREKLFDGGEEREKIIRFLREDRIRNREAENKARRLYSMRRRLCREAFRY